MDKQASIQKLFKNINLDEDAISKIASFGEMKSFSKNTTIKSKTYTKGSHYPIEKEALVVLYQEIDNFISYTLDN